MGISLSLPSALAAEKKKKSAVKNTASQTQTSNQQIQAVENTTSVKKAIWEQEPTSFMGIELGQPLSKSVSTNCPVDNFGLVDDSAVKSLGSLCQIKEFFIKDDSYSVYGFQVPQLFQDGYITTLDGRLDGAVGWFKIRFVSSNFSQVMEMLTIKYGSPHKKEVEKLKTNGGAEFDNIVLSWSGKNVLIKVESLAERSYDYENGVINIYTSEYLTKISNSSNEAAQKGVAGL